ncbi:MAG: hypothetical protein BGO69_18210 [Bacteroidetes bacterium 46-16]|nr:MAG: hypothetical protein BGO69_18210 [Bacteroidetes bacterium 46-16]
METKHVFISHHSADEENIQKMKDLLLSKGYQIKNSSIDSSKPNDAMEENYIKSLLRPRIEWASTMVVLIGPDTHTRDWVNWEIEYANSLSKRIIGVYINGAGDSDVPDSFNDCGDALVGWTGDRIIGAIEGEIDNIDNNWQKPDGTPRPTISLGGSEC